MITECRQVVVNIEYLQASKKVDNKKMAKVMGISPATFQNRKNKPNTLTLGEIEKAARFFQITSAQLITPFEAPTITPIQRKE